MSDHFERYPFRVTVLLIGSLSRGEASWFMLDDEPQLVSDIEFLLFLDSPEEHRATIARSFAYFASALKLSEDHPTLHLDYTLIAYSQIPKLERKLIVFESKEYGRVLCGPEVRHLLPDIALANVNMMDLKDILNHRLYSMIYYGRLADHGSATTNAYVLAKNGLDLLTLYLASNFSILEAGYARRLQCLLTLDVSNDIARFFSTCFKVKMRPDSATLEELAFMNSMVAPLADRLDRTTVVWPWLFRNPALQTFRRALGILRRGVVTRVVPVHPRSHFRRMLAVLDSRDHDRDFRRMERIRKVHYVLYGYDLESTI